MKEDQKHSISKSDDLQNLLIKLTVKARAEKAWLLYEFLLSLNPPDKLNDAHAWKRYSSLYPLSTEYHFQVNWKKNWLDILERGSNIKSTKLQILRNAAAKIL